MLEVKSICIFQRDSNQPINTSSSVSILHQEHVVVREKTVDTGKNFSLSFTLFIVVESYFSTFLLRLESSLFTMVTHKLGKRFMKNIQ